MSGKSAAAAQSRVVILLALLASMGLCIAAENMDPAQNGSQYAWSENAGWLNAEPLGDGGPGLEVRDENLVGWIWGENVGWISLSCENTGSCGGTDYGVTNDGCGLLGGYAWSENGGWINFAANTAQAWIDPVTGEFHGHAWSENLGWIALSADGPGAFRLITAWRVAAPVDIVELTVEKTPGGVALSWPPVPLATRYDIVTGDLQALQASGGDFATASDGCLAEDFPATLFEHPGFPTAGEGTWYLVRADNCGGSATYDSPAPSLVRPRDSGLAADPGACY